MKLAGMTGRRGVLAGLAALAGCQQPTPPAEATAPRLGPGRTGYVSIQAPITPRLRDVFAGEVSRLLAQDAAQIYVLIASPGGVISAAQDMIRLMDQAHASRGVTFTTHNTGLVASAACYVFLAGQRRLSVPQGKFLFHEAALVADGPLSSHMLAEESEKMQQTERSFVAMLAARTKVTSAEAVSFTRRTVVLSADEAQRDGVTDATADFTLPPGATVFRIRAVPGPLAPGRQPA